MNICNLNLTEFSKYSKFRSKCSIFTSSWNRCRGGVSLSNHNRIKNRVKILTTITTNVKRLVHFVANSKLDSIKKPIKSIWALKLMVASQLLVYNCYWTLYLGIKIFCWNCWLQANCLFTHNQQCWPSSILPTSSYLVSKLQGVKTNRLIMWCHHVKPKWMMSCDMSLCYPCHVTHVTDVIL